MEQERNFVGFPGNIMNYGWYNYPKFENNLEEMPPYMYGKCMGNCEPKQCDNYMVPPMYMNTYCRGEMCMNPYDMQAMNMNMGMNMEPIETMCGKTYKTLMMDVKKTVSKIAMENMGMLPKAISKDMFNRHMNDLIIEVMKKEVEIKKMVMVERDETEETEDDRAFCPYCNGLLKNLLSVLLVTELVKGGCTHCR